LIDSDGDVLDSMNVDQAMYPAKLAAMLRQAVTRKHPPQRKEMAANFGSGARPSKAAAAGKSPGLAVWTRNLGSDWTLGVAEDRIMLTDREWTALLPEGNLQNGASWTVSNQITDKIFPYFFPPLKNYDARNSVIIRASLRATASEVSQNRVRVSLRGTLEMDHPLRALEKPIAPPGKTNGHVSASLIGSAVFNRDKRSVESLRLVSEHAEYVWHWQGNAVRTNFLLGAELEP
jgi:hypothetical protein